MRTRDCSCLPVVGDLLDDFGSHPERSANHGIPLRQSGIQLCGHAEVSELRLSLLREKNITGFDVLRVRESKQCYSMDLFMCVQIGNSQQDGGQQVLDFSLTEDPALFVEGVCERAAVAKFHHDLLLNGHRRGLPRDRLLCSSFRSTE